MDRGRVALLRDVLDGTPWIRRSRDFARGIRSHTTPGGLLLVGTPEDEPWHMAAHFDEESRYSGLAQLKPTLVRWAPPPDAPAHLAVTMERITAAVRGESLVVVSQHDAPQGLLERVADARRKGATIFAIDGGDTELEGLAHESLVVPPAGLHVPLLDLDNDMSFDVVEHLVSAAAGDVSDQVEERRLRRVLSRVLDVMSGPQTSGPR